LGNQYVLSLVPSLLSYATVYPCSVLVQISEHLLNAITEIAKNPTHPEFNHSAFEAIGCAVAALKTQLDQAPSQEVQSALATVTARTIAAFQVVSAADVEEFVPYLFQLLSLVVLAHSGLALPAQLGGGLFASTYNSDNYKHSANVPALIMLLRAYLRAAKDTVRPQLQAVFGVAAHLMGRESQNHHGFDMMMEIAHAFGPECVPALPAIISTALQGLQKQGRITPKYKRRCIVLFSQLSIILGPEPVVAAFASAGPTLLDQVVATQIQPHIGFVKQPTERATAAVGLARLFSQVSSPQTKAALLDCVAKLLAGFAQSAEAGKTRQEKNAERRAAAIREVASKQSFKASFSELTSCKLPVLVLVDQASVVETVRQTLRVSAAQVSQLGTNPELIPTV
ncbi:hypothetical protein KIPB_004817, partial [Kipferlia bialata]